jgi:Ca2+/Na+ antiporter
LDLYTTIKYLFWNYGHLVILLGIGAIYICLNILRYSKNEKISIINITYSCFQLVGLLLAAVFLIGFFVEFEVVRVSRLATMFSVVTCGLFSIYLVRLDKKYLVFPFILIMILSSFFVFNIYSSEHQSSPNYQLTNMEYSGLEWIISHRNESIPFISNTNIQKNELYLLGPRESSTHNMIYIRKNLPVNFGYGEYNSLSDAVEEELEFNGTFYTVYDRYMEINYRVLPKEVWDIASKYDQNILKYDESVNSIYSNGEHENWLVKD